MFYPALPLPFLSPQVNNLGFFFYGVCCGESGFGSGFLMVGVGLAVVADGSGCDGGFWFLRFLMMGGGLLVSDGGGGWRCLLR